MKNVKYVPVANSIAEWANKEALLKRWEGLNKHTLDRLLTEMRNDKRFRVYVINPTHKLVFINLEGFEEFLIWKEKEQYR